MHFLPLALLAATSLVSASSSSSSSSSSFVCPSSSSDKHCGQHPDVRLPHAVDESDPLLRFVFDHGPLPGLHAPNAHAQSRKCTKELESIVYIPPSAVKDYLTRIIKELAIKILASAGQSLFTPQTIDLIKTISARYNVQIQIQPVFNNRPNVVFNPNLPPTAGPRIIGHLVGPTYLNQIAFQFSPENRVYSVAMYAPELNVAHGSTLIVSVAADSVTFLCN